MNTRGRVGMGWRGLLPLLVASHVASLPFSPA